MHNLDWLCRSARQWYIFSPLNRLNLFFQDKQNWLSFHMKLVLNETVADLDLWDTYFGWSCPCCSVAKLCPPLCDPVDCSTPGSFVFHIVPEFAQIPICWVSDAIQPFHLLLPFLPLPSVFLRIRVFSNVRAVRIRWPRYWSFSFSISPSNEYSGLISFRMNYFDLLKSILQHHSSKASVLWYSAFFLVYLSHLYITTSWSKLN